MLQKIFLCDHAVQMVSKLYILTNFRPDVKLSNIILAKPNQNVLPRFPALSNGLLYAVKFF